MPLARSEVKTGDKTFQGKFGVKSRFAANNKKHPAFRKKIGLPQGANFFRETGCL
jgi:hypothetical protein